MEIGADQARDEQNFREAERVMLFIDDAARNATRAAEELKAKDAEPYLVNALETAAGAMRAEHSRLMKSVYYPAPQGENEDQKRLAM
ncbi:MAG: hypothetical protein AABM29_05030 [Actinomycetota bacterium]